MSTLVHSTKAVCGPGCGLMSLTVVLTFNAKAPVAAVLRRPDLHRHLRRSVGIEARLVDDLVLQFLLLDDQAMQFGDQPHRATPAATYLFASARRRSRIKSLIP